MNALIEKKDFEAQEDAAQTSKDGESIEEKQPKFHFMEEDEEENIDDQEKEISQFLIMPLQKPLVVDGVEYTELDLSALEDFSTRDYEKAIKQYRKIYGKQSNAMIEYELDFGFLIAEIVTGFPHADLKKMSASDSAKLRYIVGNFFLS